MGEFVCLSFFFGVFWPVESLRLHFKLSDLALGDGGSVRVERLEDLLDVGAILEGMSQMFCHITGDLPRDGAITPDITAR